MKYIAYGSNMVQSQMAYRCPNAKLLGMGYLRNYRLEFYLHATVESSPSEIQGVPVAVWEIDDSDERSLDRYESYPSYYTKRQVTVEMNDGSQIEGMIYLMCMIHHFPPAPDYYEDIRQTYEELGIAHEIDRVLRPALDRSKQRSRR